MSDETASGSTFLDKVQFGKMYRMNAEKPYYLLEVRKAGDEDRSFRKIIFASTTQLYNLYDVRKKITAELSIVFRVKQSEWEAKLGELLRDSEKHEFSDESKSTLHKMFEEYLTCGQYQTHNPIRIKRDDVYLRNDVYHFTATGFRTYLRMKKHHYGKIDFREKLEFFGCSEGEISYTRRDGSTNTIKCWMKKVDDSLKRTILLHQDIRNMDARLIEANKLEEEKDGEPWFLEKGTIYE